MKKRVVITVSIILFLFLINFVLAESISEDLHLNLQTTDDAGKVITGTFSFYFNISTTENCNNVIYSNYTDLTTDARGIISHYLPNVSLDYDEQYYLCYYRNGVLKDSSKIARVPYTFTARNITLSGVEIDTNLDMGSYNVSAEYFIGSGKYLTGLNVSALDMSDYVPFIGALLNLNLGDNNFTVNGTTFFVDTNNSRVGIGTITPLALLHVNGSAIISGTLNMDSNKITDLANGTSATDAVTLAQLQSVNASAAVESDPYWAANYSTFLTHITYEDLMNGTLEDYFDTLYQAIGEYLTSANIVEYVGNWSADKENYYNTTEIYEINLSMQNYVDYVGGRWDSNYTNMQSNCGSDFVTGLYANGTFMCGSVEEASESDPYWTANYTAFNESWSLTFNQTTNDSISNYIVSYVGIQNESLVNYITVVNTSMQNYVDSTFVNQSEIGNLSVNDTEYLDGYDSGFFMPLNQSVYGQFDFNGGWQEDGLSIIGGNLFAQMGYFYNISSLSVTNLNINGSLYPIDGFDNQFDIGTPTLRWKDLYLGGNAYINGSVIADYIVGNGSQITGIRGSQIANDLNWINETTLSENETDPKWTANYTAFNVSWSLMTNTSYMTGENFTIQNGSIVNWATSTFISLLDIINQVGNWSADKENYYNTTEIYEINLSMQNYVDYVGGLWNSNYTNMQSACPEGYYAYGFYENGSIKCRNESVGAEVDPYWTANWTNVAFTNIHETFTENVTFVKNISVDGTTFHVDSNNNRVGIGTSIPSATLEVVGTFKANSSQSSIHLDSEGNILIGI